MAPKKLLYCAFVRSVLEYQNMLSKWNWNFLSVAGFIIKIHLPLHDYSQVISYIGLGSLINRRIMANLGVFNNYLTNWWLYRFFGASCPDTF